MDRTHPLVIGHRGAPGYRPEHTRSGYQLAVEAGVDAVEPDVVLSRDGVLVVRHENDITDTTDVADRAEFADRRATKTIDGNKHRGWFTEDFTWSELQGLRCRERLPKLRPGNVVYNDTEPVLRLRDVLELVAGFSEQSGRTIGVVLEIKHATYFAQLGWDLAAIVAGELQDAGWAHGAHPLVIESFESTVLGEIRAHGVVADFVYLIEASGTPFDLLTARADEAPSYAQTLTPAGLDALVGAVDGISVHKQLILAGKRGLSVVTEHARERGLRLFTWTCRPENRFLQRRFRVAGSDWGNWQAEWSVIAAAGVDGVFVDHPDLGVDFFRKGR